MLQSDQIKPCPFCGHGVKFTHLLEGTPYENWFIGCVNPECEAEIKTPYKTQEEAIAAWNHRVDGEPISAPIRIAETVRGEPIDMEALESFTKECTERFGEDVLWHVLFLIFLIDRETWKFPDYVRVGPLTELVDFLESNEELRKVFGKTDSRFGEEKSGEVVTK